MNEEEMITSYIEYKESIETGKPHLIKGMGRLHAYEGLEHIRWILENEYYSEKFEDSFIGIMAFLNYNEKAIKQLQNNWNELKKWCKENQYDDNFDSYQVDTYTTYGVILKKMQELEQGKDG